MKKRIIALLLTAVLMLTFVGCADKKSADAEHYLLKFGNVKITGLPFDVKLLTDDGWKIGETNGDLTCLIKDKNVLSVKFADGSKSAVDVLVIENAPDNEKTIFDISLITIFDRIALKNASADDIIGVIDPKSEYTSYYSVKNNGKFDYTLNIHDMNPCGEAAVYRFNENDFYICLRSYNDNTPPNGGNNSGESAAAESKPEGSGGDNGDVSADNGSSGSQDGNSSSVGNNGGTGGGNNNGGGNNDSSSGSTDNSGGIPVNPWFRPYVGNRPNGSVIPDITDTSETDNSSDTASGTSKPSAGSSTPSESSEPVGSNTDNFIDMANYRLKDGEVFFGRYPYIKNKSDIIAPIVWQVLDEKDGKLLLITKYCIDNHNYHTTQTGLGWGGSTMYEWLNGVGGGTHTYDFLPNAFTEAEQAAIATTHVVYNTDLDDGAVDVKVFVLSVEELDQYLPSMNSRITTFTSYGYRIQAYHDDSNLVDGYPSTAWWTRSQSPQYGATVVQTDGSLMFNVPKNSGDFNAPDKDIKNMPVIGVRPALWVDKSAVNYG